MGRVCAWCGMVLEHCTSPDKRVSHTICGGCFEELQSALSRSGLRAKPLEASTAST